MICSANGTNNDPIIGFSLKGHLSTHNANIILTYSR